MISWMAEVVSSCVGRRDPGQSCLRLRTSETCFGGFQLQVTTLLPDLKERRLAAPRFRLAFLLGSPRLFPAFVARLFPGRGGPEQRGPGRMPESLQAASIKAFTLA